MQITQRYSQQLVINVININSCCEIRETKEVNVASHRFQFPKKGGKEFLILFESLAMEICIHLLSPSFITSLIREEREKNIFLAKRCFVNYFPNFLFLYPFR